MPTWTDVAGMALSLGSVAIIVTLAWLLAQRHNVKAEAKPYVMTAKPVNAFSAAGRIARRRVDMEMFWPACLRIAREKYGNTDTALQHAKAAFAVHVFNDPAWTIDYDELMLTAFIDCLDWE